MSNETMPMTVNSNVSTTAKPETYSYKGWMNSDSFIKRCFGVFGYYFVANLIVSIAMMVVVGGIFMAVGGMALLASMSQR